MKDIARMALTDGMVLGKDITSFSGDVIAPAGTKVDKNLINKLTRFNIMVVTIMEDVDYATNYFERIRLSDGFRAFEKQYNEAMPIYKKIMSDFIESDVSVPVYELIVLYEKLTQGIRDCELILDYLYNMLPTEDDLTYAHCLNSALIAGVFADFLNLSPEEKEILIQCAFFYDIGKLKLPHELIWKPSKLTPIEFAQIKTHTILGFQLIQDQPLDENILKATLSHHEKYDGSGYPSRLHDVQINKYARIISIIDSYEAMTSARTYRASKHPFQIIEIFEQDSTKYDLEILNPILYRLANHMVGLNVKLNDDTEAEVILINNANLSRPLLKRKDSLFIDLMQRRDLTIMGIY